jgi:1,4-dihydroxy-2-naphthoate octaprenyltransferase
VVGFAAGWAAAAPLDFADPLLLAGAASAALTAVGLYPATQVFQVEEDRARGDRTLAVTLGPASALRLGALLLLAAAALSAWAANARFGLPDGAAVALGYLLLAAWQLRLSTRVARPALYRRAMRLVNGGTAGFLIFLLVKAL